MRTYIIRRLLLMVPVFLGILFILFMILEATPGGPENNLIDPMATPEMRAEMVEKLGLNQPFHIRFVKWIKEAAKGNFGYSILHKKPVTETIKDYIGPTFALSLSALIFALLVGIPAGVVSATKQYSLADNALTVFSLIGISLPSFFFGLLLLKFFAVDNQLLPLFGLQDAMLRKAGLWVRLADRAKHMVLPTIVLGMSSTATFMRYTRSSMLEVIKQDYVRTARAKGLKDQVVIYKHAFRNAVIPIITLLGFQIPSLLSGAVVTESIFGLPGIGDLSVKASLTRNYPLILGINAMLSLVTLLSTLVADILYAIADPRVKYD